jgi:hypothetical protein
LLGDDFAAPWTVTVGDGRLGLARAGRRLGRLGGSSPAVAAGVRSDRPALPATGETAFDLHRSLGFALGG